MGFEAWLGAFEHRENRRLWLMELPQRVGAALGLFMGFEAWQTAALNTVEVDCCGSWQLPRRGRAVLVSFMGFEAWQRAG